jgi:hypothetical protein
VLMTCQKKKISETQKLWPSNKFCSVILCENLEADNGFRKTLQKQNDSFTVEQGCSNPVFPLQFQL